MLVEPRAFRPKHVPKKGVSYQSTGIDSMRGLGGERQHHTGLSGIWWLSFLSFLRISAFCDARAGS